MTKILIVEDEVGIQKLLQYDLKQLGYEVDVANDGLEARDLFNTNKYNLILLDWMLPHVSGIELLSEFRKKQLDTVIFMVTAKSEEENILDALEAGADDYIHKPFSPRVLTARIKAHLRKRTPHMDAIQNYGNLQINYDSYEVLVNGENIPMTKIEFDLLEYLLKYINKVMSRDDILLNIWNFDYDGDTRIVDVHVSKLRNKLKDAEVIIESVRGVGYVAKTR